MRKCSSSQRKVLCLRVTADRSASSVKECFICEEDSSEYKNKPQWTITWQHQLLCPLSVERLLQIISSPSTYTLLNFTTSVPLRPRLSLKRSVVFQPLPWRPRHSASPTCVDWWPSTVSAGNVFYCWGRLDFSCFYRYWCWDGLKKAQLKRWTGPYESRPIAQMYGLFCTMVSV